MSHVTGFEGALVRNDLSTVSETTIAYYGLNRAELVELMARWQAGERWMMRTVAA